MASKQKTPIDYNTLPILPVRDTVLFPNAILPLTVGRDSSLKLINDLKEDEKYVGSSPSGIPELTTPNLSISFKLGRWLLSTRSSSSPAKACSSL